MPTHPYRIEVDHPQDHRSEMTPDELKALVEQTVTVEPPATWTTTGYPRYLLHYETAEAATTAVEKLVAADLLFVLSVPNAEFDVWEKRIPDVDPRSMVLLAGYGTKA